MIRMKTLLLERVELAQEDVFRVAKAMGETVDMELGRGANGIAYLLESGKVLKITADTAEVALASRLRVKRLFKHVVNVYDVRKITDLKIPSYVPGVSSPGYAIIQDRVNPLPDNHRRIWNEVRYEFFDRGNSDAEFKRVAPDRVAGASKTEYDAEFIDRVAAQRKGVLRDFSELRIFPHEAHGANMGWNVHGNLVHFDAWQLEHYTQGRKRWDGSWVRDENDKVSVNVNQAIKPSGLGPDIS